MTALKMWIIFSGKLDPKRADAVTKLCQRAMGLFPEAPRDDPHDRMEDPEMYEALQKELRAVEQRLVKAGWFELDGHSKFRRPASKGNGKPLDASVATEILKSEFGPTAEESMQDWPEVE